MKLSDALNEQSHIFPDFYVRMLRVGEATEDFRPCSTRLQTLSRGGRLWPTVCATRPCTLRSPFWSRLWPRPC